MSYSNGCNLLRTYLEAHGKTQVAFAGELKLTPVELNHIITGRRMPGLKQAVDIEALTNGAVRPFHWFEPCQG